MKILILLNLLSPVFCQVKFVALRDKDTLTVPGALTLVKNIDRTNPDFRQWESQLLHEPPIVEHSQDRQQFHSLVKDGTGWYYSISSVVAHTCSLEELSYQEYFYDTLPREFQAGLAALVPCLVTGVPTPEKLVQRCSSETCEETIEIDFKNYTVTSDGHLVIREANESHSGWYRCSANNMCGNLTSSPVYISIRNASDTKSINDLFYVLSRRTETFDLTETTDRHLGLTKELRRNITQYEMWRLNSSQPSFNDEVLYPEPRSLYSYHYPLFESAEKSFSDLYSSPESINKLNYGGISLNNSYVTHFSYYSQPMCVIAFDTSFKAPPVIKPVIAAPAERSLDKTTIKFNVENILESNPDFQCYRNSVKLINNWKTRVEMIREDPEKIQIRVTLKYPLMSDRGYYQCSVSYDVVYISQPIYVHFEKLPSSYRVSSTPTATSASLEWEHLTQPYQGQYVVTLSGLNPRLTSLTTLIFENLTPYKNYTWQVTDTNQSPITDPTIFRTDPDIPAAHVGNFSVVRGITRLSLSWEKFPQSLWYDSFVYFTVRVRSNRSGEIRERSIRRYSEMVLLKNLYQATWYNISVAACNSIGCSGNTSNISLITKHTELSLKPAVQVTYVSINHVEILTTNVTEGVETYLELFKGSTCTSSPSLLSIKVTIPFSRVENLQTFSSYSLRIQSTNGYSTSPWSTCTTFKTKFNWLYVIFPTLSVLLVLVLMAVLRATIKSRCPDVVTKLKQALEPKYLNILYEQEEWEATNEVSIVHTKVENCDL